MSYDKYGYIVWWVDIGAFDSKALKEASDVDSLRVFVWFSHFLMFDEQAQKKGVVIVENCAKIGFWSAMTLIPPKVGAKIDRLTIGVLPVKMKKFIILECSTWMNILIAIMRPFLSKKLRSRITNYGNDYKKVAEELGGLEYYVKGFGPAEIEGTYTDDPVATKFM